MGKIDKLTELAKVHLDTDEEIVAVVQGKYYGEWFGKARTMLRNGLFLATDKRVVLYGTRMSGFEMEVFFYPNISSIELGRNWMGHRVSFFASNNRVDMEQIKTGDVLKFVEYVKSRIEKKDQETTPPEPTVDIPDQIRQLAALKDQGILTEEEFELKKTELLARI